MENGTKITFSSKNSSTYNGRKEYLVYHHHGGGTDIVGVAFYTGSAWQLLHYRYKSLNELRNTIRHKYTGSSFPDSKHYGQMESE